MSFSTLGWKDILRPIRDRLRDGLVPPKRDPSPTPEERDLQRRHDALKGFAYFDTFSQIHDWTIDSVDPLHAANTPILERSSVRHETTSPKARVLLCHDASGNYHDYEAVQGAGVDFESYTCERLQFIETFVYFSHKLVCIPPPTWINTLHRNGVKVLGTFLIERDIAGYSTLLQEKEGVDGFPLANQLAAIAKCYGFDGWLLNIEKPLPRASWNLDRLLRFIESLKRRLGSQSELIWYDALTDRNDVDYQNSLTVRNIAFAKAAGSILTNYRWTEKGAVDSVRVAQEHHLPLSNIYFGIDVWAQNAHKQGPRRVTFPAQNGGGTNTGLAVAKLAELGLSGGIFAPAWSFEHFPEHGKDVERAMWEGIALPDSVTCDCGNELTHRSEHYETHPTENYTEEAPAGSETFFYTDFERGFTANEEREEPCFNSKKMHSQIMAQSVLPHHMALESNDSGGLSWDILSSPARLRLKYIFPLSGSPTFQPQYEVVLYKLQMRGALKIHAQYRILWISLPISPNLGLSLCYSDGTTCHLPCSPEANQKDIHHQSWSIPFPTQDVRLVELRACITLPTASNEFQEVVPLMDIYEICIKPDPDRSTDQGAPEPIRFPQDTDISANSTLLINSISLKDVTAGEVTQTRVIWSIERQRPVEGLPWSDTTGPFAYFQVHVDDLPVGRSYALQYILHSVSKDRLDAGESLKVRVVGVGFDGSTAEGPVHCLRR